MAGPRRAIKLWRADAILISSTAGGLVRSSWILVALLLVLAREANGQQRTLLGTWKFDLKQAPKKEGPRIVVVRGDSSASYGTETVRWRMVGDSLALALGGEWVNYGVKLKGKRLVLSGGDLNEPVTFQRVGPPTARPDSIPIPPDPNDVPS